MKKKPTRIRKIGGITYKYLNRSFNISIHIRSAWSWSLHSKFDVIEIIGIFWGGGGNIICSSIEKIGLSCYWKKANGREQGLSHNSEGKTDYLILRLITSSSQCAIHLAAGCLVTCWVLGTIMVYQHWGHRWLGMWSLLSFRLNRH